MQRCLQILNSADDFVEHTFPIVVKKGGMFEKSGYTEASVEIAKYRISSSSCSVSVNES